MGQGAVGLKDDHLMDCKYLRQRVYSVEAEMDRNLASKHTPSMPVEKVASKMALRIYQYEAR